MNLTYLVGGGFFSLGGWISVVATTAPSRGRQSAVVLFVGTLLFAVSLVAAFASGSPRGSPTAGSGCRTSSAACASWCPGTSRCWTWGRAGSASWRGELDWWLVAVNQVGSVLFFLAGLAAFVRPATSEAINVGLVNWGTFAGAACFAVAGIVQTGGGLGDPPACCPRWMMIPSPPTPGPRRSTATVS